MLKLFSKRLTPNLLKSFTTIIPNRDKAIPSNVDLNEELSNNTIAANNLINSITVFDNFLTESEENSILDEIEPYLKQMKYEFDHWDDAIHGFRETERLNWNAENRKTIERVRKLAFPPNVNQLKHVHILDLDPNGYIKPHIDAVRFCGDTITGMSLLTDSVMRLVDEKTKKQQAKILLKRRSLYIMKGTARYDYTHEILPTKDSYFRDKHVNKTRRISVICRNEPDEI